MGDDYVDIGDVERQIAQAQGEALRWIEKAYYSQDKRGGMNADYIREGQKHLKTLQSLTGADDLVVKHVQPLVESINPCVLFQALVASGLTAEKATHAVHLMRAGRAATLAGVATAGSGSAGAGAGAAGAAGAWVAGALVVVVAAVLLYLLWKHHRGNKSRAKQALTSHYRDRIQNHGSNQGSGGQMLSGGSMPRGYNLPGRL